MSLKTTHRLHNLKNNNCPAQISITILAPHQRHRGYLVEVILQHNHNHTINVADALRFWPISDETEHFVAKVIVSLRTKFGVISTHSF